jgi:hypothetical protein
MRPALRAAAAALALAGCAVGSTDEGTSVGNPGETALRLAPDAAAAPSRARLPIKRLQVTPCGGQPVEVARDTTVDLLAEGAALKLPAEPLCRVLILPDGPLEVDLLVDGGGEAVLDLTLSNLNIRAADERGVDAGAVPVVVELGAPGWWSGVGLVVAPGEVRSVAAGDDGHDALVAAIMDGSRFYGDRDGSGDLADDERDVGGEGDGQDANRRAPPVD